jgi:hypothetical protein
MEASNSFNHLYRSWLRELLEIFYEKNFMDFISAGFGSSLM